jgi:hypothetical protein
VTNIGTILSQYSKEFFKLVQYFGWKRIFFVGAEGNFGSLEIATTAKAKAHGN